MGASMPRSWETDEDNWSAMVMTASWGSSRDKL